MLMEHTEKYPEPRSSFQAVGYVIYVSLKMFIAVVACISLSELIVNRWVQIRILA